MLNEHYAFRTAHGSYLCMGQKWHSLGKKISPAFCISRHFYLPPLCIGFLTRLSGDPSWPSFWFKYICNLSGILILIARTVIPTPFIWYGTCIALDGRVLLASQLVSTFVKGSRRHPSMLWKKYASAILFDMIQHWYGRVLLASGPVSTFVTLKSLLTQLAYPHPPPNIADSSLRFYRSTMDQHSAV